MSTMGYRIKTAREAAGLLQSQLAQAVGVKSSGVVSNWERDLNKPDAETMVRLCETLSISLSHLLDYYGDESQQHSVEPNDYAIIKKYRSLDGHGKEAVDSILEVEVARMETEAAEAAKVARPVFAQYDDDDDDEEEDWDELPRLYESSAAGYGNYWDDSSGNYEMMSFRKRDIPDGASFCVRITGMSMEPKIYEDDIVFVEGKPEIENGQIGIFLINGESFCKKLHIDRDKREVWLVSLNPESDDKRITKSMNFRTLGRVIGAYDPYAEEVRWMN